MKEKIRKININKKFLIIMMFLILVLSFQQENTIIASASEDHSQAYMDLLNQSDAVTHTDLNQCVSTEEEFREILNLSLEIVKGIDDSYKKAIAIHDWIAGNIYYDYDYLAGRNENLTTDPYAVLQSKRTVCDGYAKLTEAMFNAVGIPCYYLKGNSSGLGHAWNVAYVGGRWIWLDVTWDSGNAVSNNIFEKGEVTYDNFDVSTDEFSIKHTIHSPLKVIYHNIWYELDVNTGDLVACGAKKGDPNLVIASNVGDYRVTSIGGFHVNAEGKGFYNWIESVTLPDSITHIITRAFTGCESLKKINIPEGVEMLDYSTFQGCYSLQSVELPSTLKIIRTSAFGGCRALETITIPKSVVEIDYSAFGGCNSLKELVLPEDLKRFGGSNFTEVPITRMIFPKYITNLDEDMFWHAFDLKEVEFLGTNPEDLVIDNELYYIFHGNNLERVIVPDGYKEAYRKVIGKFNILERSEADIAAVLTEEVSDKLISGISIPTKKTLYVGGRIGDIITINPELPDKVRVVKDFSNDLEKILSEIKISYSSDDDEIAAVDSVGKVTAKRKGNVTIFTTVELANGMKHDYETIVTVNVPYIKVIKSTKTIKKGLYYSFEVKVHGYDITDIKWSSSKKSILSIDKNGRIQALTNGVAYVIVTAGDISKKIKVTIVN